MSVVSSILEIKMSSARRQLENVKSLITQPRGVFETVDEMIKTFRSSNRRIMETVGVKIPTSLQVLRRRW